MSQFNAEELISLGRQETKQPIIGKGSDRNTVKLPLDTEITHFGEIIGTLGTIDEGKRCDCPHGHLHSDGLGEDYAHTVRLSGGDIGIYCSGDSCEGLFVPDSPMANPTDSTASQSEKIESQSGVAKESPGAQKNAHE